MLNNCVHSRNLVPFINSGENSKKFHFLADHIEKCDKCKDHYLDIKKNARAISDLIPVVNISKEMQKNVQGEIKSLISKISNHEKEGSMFNFIPVAVRNHLRDIVLTFTSRTMVRAYFFLVIYVVVIKSLSLDT